MVNKVIIPQNGQFFNPTQVIFRQNRKVPRYFAIYEKDAVEIVRKEAIDKPYIS